MIHLERRHGIVLEGSADQIFALFTPHGEKLWVDGWNPEFLHPADGETCEGMVFRTRHGEEETLWACVDWAPAAHRVRYARVTPASRFGFVEVICRATAANRTEATVAYAFTALTPGGESYLSDLTEAAFAQMIEEWKKRLNQWLLGNVTETSDDKGRRGE